jgi:hypothetical protein
MFIAVLQLGWYIFTPRIGLPNPLQYSEIARISKAYFIGAIHLGKMPHLSIKW